MEKTLLCADGSVGETRRCVSSSERGNTGKREFVGRYPACGRSRCRFLRFSELTALFNYDVSTEMSAG
jgi:hypothetical protein